MAALVPTDARGSAGVSPGEGHDAATASSINTTRLADVLVDGARYARLLLVDNDIAGVDGAVSQPPTPLPVGLTNLCQGDVGLRHKVLSWEGFLTQPEVNYFRQLVYGAAPEDFGAQYVHLDETQTATTTKATSASEESSEESSDSDGDGSMTTLSADTLAMLTSMGLAPQPSSKSVSSPVLPRITKNRLRTSSFLRTAWFATGPGLKIFQTVAQRAATMLGLDPTCAEAPQVVCYPGGATYFRAHHDSGRLNDDFDRVYLDRDEHGAARVTTVFVYLTDHDIADGGATHFGYLPRNNPNGDKDIKEYHGLRVHPKAGSAAIWSNVDRDGRPDVAMVHEGESLNAGSLITMEEALRDETLPLKIGLNLWFTDRRDYPRPERTMVGEGEAGMRVYAKHDVH